MTDVTRSPSGSYAYYSFPATPERPSPAQSRRTASKPASPESEQTLGSPSSSSNMVSNTNTRTPTKLPSTPTKAGRSPASNATPKLGQAKDAGRSATQTPKSAAKSATQQAKQTASKTTNSPKLPPRPRAADDAASKAKGATSKAQEQTKGMTGNPQDKAKQAATQSSSKAKQAASQAKEAADDATSQAQDTADQGSGGINLQDNDPTEGDDEGIGGKISQGAESLEDDGELKSADPEPVSEDDEEPASGAKDMAQDTTDDASEINASDYEDVDDQAEAVKESEENDEGGKGQAGEDEEQTSAAQSKGAKGWTGRLFKSARGVASKAGGAKDTVSNTASKAGRGDVTGASQDAAEAAQDGAEDAVDDVQDASQEAKDGAEEVAQDTQDTASKAGDRAGKGDLTGAAQGAAEDAKDGAEDTVEDLKEETEDVADDAKDVAEDAAEDIQDQLPDLSILKGLKVGEGGKIFNSDGDAVGEVTEGDPDDLIDQEVGDDGDILDEDGDVIGRVKTLPQQAEQAAEDVTDKAQDVADEATDEAQDLANDAKDTAEEAAETYLPDLDILKGLEVTESGEIFDKAGNLVGKLTEGDPEQLVGQTLNEEGEVLDEDGDAIGRAETVAQPVKDAAEEAQDDIPNVSILEGMKVDEDGKVLGDDGNVIGKVTEGDAADLAGKTVNEKGEIIGEDGDVIGKVTTVADEAKDNLPDLSALEGLEVQKNGDIIGPDGNVLGRITEGDPADLAGQTLNAQGEVVDDDGDAIGRAEVVAQEAQEVQEKAEEQVDGLTPDFSIIEGKKINKKGRILDEEGEILAKLSDDSDTKKCIGKIPNENGEILDDDGEVVGHVEIVPGEAADEAMKALHPELADTAGQGPDLSILDGYKVNKKGDVLNEDGEPIGRLSEGELKDVSGKKVNDKGEILDKDGNVIGKVELIEQDGDGEEAEGDANADGEGEEEGEEGEQNIDEDGDQEERPPLSTLEGLKCNKTGWIVDSDGCPVGQLVEGDPKKIARAGLQCDDQGQFWDNRGNVIGRAETIAREDNEDEAPFAGLEGLLVVKDGWVEDENGNRVGYLTEGDTKKLVGRAVDEDGDVLDKRGNTIGHAERYDEPEEEQEAAPDLSMLEGLTCNKQGNVIGYEGVPIAHLVEGNPKELAGRKIDGQGQIWNDSGKVVGRCELIPEEEREARAEGPFAGLEGLVVVKGGWVEDEDGNRVGQVVDGEPKKLVGRAVDEDGDIIDKYGNVKGHAEPWDEPDEEEADLSALAGKTVNKAGNVVDENGTVYGRITEGDAKKLAGRKVDGQGQIWSDDGKVIGHAELITGDQQQKGPEGPFAGFGELTLGKDGLVQDQSGDTVGRIIEGDPKKLHGRKVDEDGEILDRNGNVLGRAERWEPEEKERDISPMSGRKVNKQGEVYDENGDLIGRLTEGKLGTCIGKKIDDNGNVVDNDGNKIGECTLLENIEEEEEEEEEQEEETEEQRKQRENAEIAKKMIYILRETLDKVNPICQSISEKIEKADRTPKDELDEEQLVNDVKPLLEDGGKILQECNGAIRGLDPDGSIAATAKQRAATGEATKEEHQLADLLKELTSTVVKTIDNGKKRIQDMPHAKKKLNPLWGLLSEPLFQIIAAVGLLLTGVLGLVGRLLNGLGLGGLVNGLLGGLGIDKLLGGMGLGSLTESLTGGGNKKK